MIEAHNADVDASLAYLSKVVWNKEVRKLEDLPNADPEVCNGELPGDAQWDPLRLAETKTHLLVYREAEIKHGRLAMLAAAGWPISELVPHGKDSILQETAGRAPSVLNGGLFSNNGVAVLAFFALVGTYETQETFGDKRLPKRATKLGALHQADLGGDDAAWGYGVAGDNNFDPLELYGTFGDDAEGRKAMRDAEIANGRLAMVAIAFAAFFEAVSGAPVTTLGGPALFVGGLGAAAKAVDLAVPNETKEQIKKDLGL